MENKGKDYYGLGYDTKERFISYWQQIYEIMELRPNSFLEIGVGNGFLYNYLDRRGFNPITMDINKSLKPSIVGDIINIPIKDGSFDVVSCYEVLEHLPYEYFIVCLKEIFRVSRKYVVISLPDVERAYKIHLKLPKLREFKKLIILHGLKGPEYLYDGEHYWEIGKCGFQLKRIIHEIENAGFKIVKTYRLFENPYHRFFVLAKVGG